MINEENLKGIEGLTPEQSTQILELAKSGEKAITEKLQQEGADEANNRVSKMMTAIDQRLFEESKIPKLENEKTSDYALRIRSEGLDGKINEMEIKHREELEKAKSSAKDPESFTKISQENENLRKTLTEVRDKAKADLEEEKVKTKQFETSFKLRAKMPELVHGDELLGHIKDEVIQEIFNRGLKLNKNNEGADILVAGESEQYQQYLLTDFYKQSKIGKYIKDPHSQLGGGKDPEAPPPVEPVDGISVNGLTKVEADEKIRAHLMQKGISVMDGKYPEMFRELRAKLKVEELK
jgi:hypothetical protein